MKTWLAGAASLTRKMPDRHATRRQRGAVQNFANQLAQMAVGMEAMFLGSVLQHQPRSGVIEIDAISRSSEVNGEPATLALATYLNQWTIAELVRRNLGAGWLRAATVTIKYTLTPGNRENTDRADFEAVAVVSTDAGDASATFANFQLLVLG